ncbi:MAG: Clp protease N-terminal domain-containing protein, partial [Marmoricola sp.]
MFERFTKPARRVVEQATDLAARAQASHVRPEHLLLALLDDKDNLAVRVLTDLGATPDRLREELERRRSRYLDGLGDEDAEALATIGIDLHEVLRRIGRGSGEGRRRGRPRFSRESKKVLELSLREALALRHNYIGTEHLLLGLVRGGDPAVRDTLATFDVTPTDLRAA